ncbi:bifunctional diaminohydroxyphosphoribosylaminopyrimidine deaminase/5-amino-6-(5-phosphoribosylamino)uracil reductase RibD [Ureibacillus terrenus]|uniref:bifunctional diaminohydroxyphosphoribosylaminopyrimidine deaminase/5-amino-6-(5-phosphoribosylamino)uracil reductase RibD n=1 Tax=Ureibacillus terrenus TaxID=118246 RepID=UPI002E1D3111|nr:bifunctional diaminohydroxyphosphoribosylaminopyrimidine deaminase/5-amino-6-(5-phosphoribosylamino)uracil reductase RibD [Ureibacillus terrenus]
MYTDREYMELALNLAKTAKGKTNPNPLVGAVLVKDGVIVGTGLHRKAGEPHAEVHAFNMAGDYAKGATLYVTLEPCSHYGKTPPCVDLVKNSGVERVVVATLDPNPKVSGRGVQILRDAGIEVEVGLLEKKARKLNERFFHNMLTNRPFVTLKYAMTLDGKIATYTGHSKWISGENSRLQVHQLRDEMDAILVGIGTVLKDNPFLTTRLPDRQGKNPVRVILDSRLQIPLDANVLNDEAKTIIVTTTEADPKKIVELEKNNVTLIYCSKNEQGICLEEMLDQLYKFGITDILVEGGGEVNASFIRAGLVNKFIIYIAPKLLGGRRSISPVAGEDLETMDLAAKVEFDSFERIGEDLCIIAYPKQGEHHG